MAPDAETKERGDIARLARILKLILGQLLLLVLVLIAVVFAGEWYARKKFPDLAYVAERQQRPEDLFVQFDARYGWANRPGADTRFRRRDFDTHVEIKARALGLDCGPMSGFDNEKVDQEFFAGTPWKSNFLVNLGYGDRSRLHPRSPRFDFDDACRIL